MGALRTLSLLGLALLGCDPADCDVDRWVTDFAPPDAIDCGAVYQWTDSEARAVEAHDCAARALADGSPFHVSLDRAVSDGRTAIAYVGDGTGVVRLKYEAIYGQLFSRDRESLRAASCSDFVDLGPCDRPFADLCFDCPARTRLEAPTCP